MSFQVRFSGDPAAAIARATEAVESAVARVVFDTAALLLTQIRANASTGFHKPGAPHIPGTGPGPNVGAGDYLRTWHVDTGYDAAGNPTALVSTNAPQAARLEYGYVDTDSRGRTYSQPPYPHVRPAIEQIQPRFVQMMRDALNRSTR